jgi:hypothetical protein
MKEPGNDALLAEAADAEHVDAGVRLDILRSEAEEARLVAITPATTEPGRQWFLAR